MPAELRDIQSGGDSILLSVPNKERQRNGVARLERVAEDNNTFKVRFLNFWPWNKLEKCLQLYETLTLQKCVAEIRLQSHSTTHVTYSRTVTVSISGNDNQLHTKVNLDEALVSFVFRESVKK